MTALFVLATFARLVWTNPAESFDAIRARQINSPGDTVVRTIYANAAAPLVVKQPGTPGTADTAYLSFSTANVVGPAAARIILETHNSAGWSPPGNVCAVFYAAKDTNYVREPGFQWYRGPGLIGHSRALGDSTWDSFMHQEVAQDRVRARLCAIYGYACRRGVRDTSWCGGGQ